MTKIDSYKIAALLRGGMLPQASGDPAAMRATPAPLRRRTHLMRNRAELLSHVPNTNPQDNLPAIGKKIAYKANREGGAERVNDPAVQKTIAVDLALITYADALLRDLERSIVQTATPHDGPTLYVLQTGPGMGTLRSLGRLYEIHDIGRFPSVPDFASSTRLVKCSQESAGQRLGPSGKTSGNAHLKWAFSEAATLFLRHHPNGQTLLPRLEKKHGKGKALTIPAHNLARAVYDRLTRKPAFALDRCLRA
jgi:transposase